MKRAGSPEQNLGKRPSPEARTEPSISELSTDLSPTLRFKVGDLVLCKTGLSQWESGAIVQLWGKSDCGGMTYPYVVGTKNGRLIRVPYDDEEFCKEAVLLWWEEIMMQVNLSDAEGVQLLEEFSQNQDLNAVSCLHGATALSSALMLQWDAGVHALLRLRADPNFAVGPLCARPLSFAVVADTEKSEPSLTEALLLCRADPQLQDKDPSKKANFSSTSFEEREWHRTALHYAAAAGDVRIAKLLLSSRAEPNIMDAQCKMPLHLAVEADQNREATVHLLIQSRADLNVGHMGIGLRTSPLIDAAYRNDLELLEWLLNARANVNHRGKQDMPALHVAVRGRHIDAIRKLLEARADTHLQVGGKSAGDLAIKNGLYEMAALLGCQGQPEGLKQSEGLKQKTPRDLQDEKLRSLLFLD